MIDLCLLGCGGGMPMPFRNLSATLINYKGRKILIDCGEGTQVSMRMVGWGFKSVDLICITHCHGDHILGLPGLLSTIGNSGRTEPLLIIGPKGIKEVVESLMIISKYLPYEVKILENPREIYFKLSKERISLLERKEDSNTSDLDLKTLEVDHSSPCIGYSLNIKRNRKFNVEKAMENQVPKELWNKLQKGESIEYNNKKYYSNMVLGDERKGIKISLITDSRPINNITEFVYDSDLFICEGTYGDDLDYEKAVKNKHMTFREAAKLSKEANVKKLLLTHFSPSMQNPEEFLINAEEEFENVEIGFDRLITTVSYRE